MILTVTLNPAVDKMIKLDDFKIGALSRVKELRKDIGGKGINASKVIKSLGGESRVFVLLGGVTGEVIKSGLISKGIDFKSSPITEETRTNLKIVDIKLGSETEINEVGPHVQDEEIKSLEDALFEEIKAGDFVILGGSLPKGVSIDIYSRMVKLIKERGAKAILDSSGEALLKGIEGKPYLVKPNLVELEGLFNRKLESDKEIVSAAKELYQRGIEVVVISLGNQGAIVVSKEGVWKLIPPKVEVKSSIGAGDTLVAAIVMKLEEGKTLKEAIIYAVAASADTVTKSGTEVCDMVGIVEILYQVKLEIIEQIINIAKKNTILLKD